MQKKKEVFTVKVVDRKTQQEKEVELAVLAPNHKTYAKARFYQNKTFSEAMEAGAPLRARLDNYIREQGIWDDEKQQQVLELGQVIVENEDKLARGGCSLKEAYNAALDLRRARFAVDQLMQERNELDAHTCEGQATNARFDALVANSVVYNDSGEPYFKSVEDYRDRQDEDATIMAARIFASNFYGVNADYQRNLPENQFLLKFGFCNEDLHLIDKQGRLVDAIGRLVNEDGVLIDHDGNPVDEDGNPVNNDGSPIIEQQPFLDDDGNPLGDDGQPIEQEEEPKPSPAKKQTAKKKAAPKKKKAAKKKTE